MTWQMNTLVLTPHPILPSYSGLLHCRPLPPPVDVHYFQMSLWAQIMRVALPDTFLLRGTILVWAVFLQENSKFLFFLFGSFDSTCLLYSDVYSISPLHLPNAAIFRNQPYTVLNWKVFSMKTPLRVLSRASGSVKFDRGRCFIILSAGKTLTKTLGHWLKCTLGHVWVVHLKCVWCVAAGQSEDFGQTVRWDQRAARETAQLPERQSKNISCQSCDQMMVLVCRIECKYAVLYSL